MTSRVEVASAVGAQLGEQLTAADRQAHAADCFEATPPGRAVATPEVLDGDQISGFMFLN
jgi:hypothetical protein